MQLVGLKLDPEKAQLPSTVWHALGVVFDMRILHQNKLLSVRPKPTRVLNAIVEMVNVLQANRLRPLHAAKLFWKKKEGLSAQA